LAKKEFICGGIIWDDRGKRHLIYGSHRPRDLGSKGSHSTHGLALPQRGAYQCMAGGRL